MQELEFIIEKKEVKNSYIFLSLKSENFEGEVWPGQFIMVKIPSPDLILRRPFSIFFTEDKKIEILFQICGKGTEILSKLEKEDSLKVLMPLGNHFNVRESGPQLIIGGGRGIAPLFFLSNFLLKRGINFKVIYGGKSLSDLPVLERFRKINIEPVITTEDGSAGIKGLVTDPLKEIIKREKISVIYSCGPKRMMEKVFSIANEFSISTQFSLEERMACGFGACWGCVSRIRKEGKEKWVKICNEGTVFNGDEIVW
ncbi:MAG: dihydroorotate dehydrogenase electron transfer subunit [Candidatus Aminicenantia bacterium]